IPRKSLMMTGSPNLAPRAGYASSVRISVSMTYSVEPSLENFMPLGTPRPEATARGSVSGEGAWKIAPRVASNPRCISPAQRPPPGSNVMSLKRHPASISAETPDCIAPAVSIAQKARSSVPKTPPSGRQPSDQTGSSVGTTRKAPCANRSKRGPSGSVQSNWPRDQSGDSPIIAPASQIRRATASPISGMPHLMQHAEASHARFTRLDDLALDAVGGKRTRVQTRQRAASCQRYFFAGETGIRGERIRNLGSDQQPANVGARVRPAECSADHARACTEQQGPEPQLARLGRRNALEECGAIGGLALDDGGQEPLGGEAIEHLP